MRFVKLQSRDTHIMHFFLWKLIAFKLSAMPVIYANIFMYIDRSSILVDTELPSD
jgi:hypothetical protein